jgi:hypothetical protein
MIFVRYPILKRLMFGILLCAGLIACEPGVKKQNGQSVEKDGLEKCAKIEAELRELKVELNGKSPGQHKDAAQLTHDIPVESYDVIRQKLEDYLQNSNRLLTLADSRLVEFSDKNSIALRTERASKFLGQIYAQEEPDLLRDRTVISYLVDLAEFEVRAGRASLKALELEALGIPLFIASSEIESLKSILKSKDVKTLKIIIEKARITFHDFGRAHTLLNRNNDFKLKKYFLSGEMGQAFVGYNVAVLTFAHKALDSKSTEVK